MVETYRSRFGIESSYRQMNQARLRTCSRSPELRLLAVAIAFVLRNLWALCRWMTILTICWQALSETAKLLNTIKASEMKDTASKLEIPKYRNMNKTQLLLEIVEAHEALPAFSE
jgi:hypothetical protein